MALLVGTALIGVPVAGSLVLPSQAAPSQAAQPIETPTPPTINAPATFSGIVKAVAPAVVNVSVTGPARTAASDGGRAMPQVPPGSPFEEFFRDFFQNRPGGAPPPRSAPSRGVGSGFIIDPAGYVVTNNHVVENASEVTVTLDDGTQLDATIVGRDPKTDLALLKVETDADLPFVEWGDSEAAEVGDWVVAVGNPFGLGGSVTTGIISARGRNLQSGPFDDFLQIDAAINRGNSGGPTFGLDGKVLGINTAIYSPSGGSVGIGFAIPSNMAREVVDQLREGGVVARGWLGVQIQAVTPAMAEALGLEEAQGAIIADALDDGPAELAGIEQGDVILSFDGQAIDELSALPRIVASTEIGRAVPVEILRDGERMTVEVTVGRMPEDEQVAAVAPDVAPVPDANSEIEAALGLAVAPLTPDVRQRYGVEAEAPGVLITGVREDGPARETGVGPGDIILRVGGQSVETVEDVVTGIEQARANQRSAVMLLLSRQGGERFVAVPLDAA